MTENPRDDVQRGIELRGRHTLCESLDELQLAGKAFLNAVLEANKHAVAIVHPDTSAPEASMLYDGVFVEPRHYSSNPNRRLSSALESM